MANLVETTQAATDNVLERYDSVKPPKKDLKKILSADKANNEHSFSNLSTTSKRQREVFGATILPSNLSFDNMKKLSMNQIKLEEIPLVNENEVAEVLVSEKTSTSKESRQTSDKKSEEEVGLESPPVQKRDLKISLDVRRVDRFEDIPGPRLLESMTSAVKYAARHTTVYFLVRLLQNGSTGLFRKYGPIVRLPEIMGGRILLVNRSEHISAIQEQDRRHPASSSLDALECSRLRRHGRKREWLSVRETEWEKTREAINTATMKEEEKYFDGLEENGSRLVKCIRSVKSRENEVSDDFDGEVNKWSLQCLFQILFDKSLDFLDPETTKWPSKNAQLLASLREATRSLNLCENGFQLWRFMSTSSSVSLDNSCQTIETILSHHVYQSQKDLQNKDGDHFTITETMLQGGLTKTDVITNVLDTLLIGMNATTNTLSFLLYHLAKNPRMQTELLNEIKEILPEKYSRLEYDCLSSLNLLAACLKETLRLKMPIPILTKYLNRDVVLSNFQVPRGTFVVMAAQLETLREENFEASREFRPKRWLQTENKQYLPCIPLSAFSRNSFETRLAEIAILACVAQIIRNFKVEFNHGELTAAASPLSYPTKPLRFSFLEREG